MRSSPLVIGRAVLAALTLTILFVAGGAAQEPENPFWVQNHRVTELWSGPDDNAEFFGWLPQWSYLRVERWAGQRLYVFNPRSQNYAYVDEAAVGPSGPPPADYLAPPKVLEEVHKPGRLLGQTDVYGEPQEDPALWLRTETHNTPVSVAALVESKDGRWYRLENGDYVRESQVRLPGPLAASYDGKWIDANLTEPVIVTAYEGDRPVYAALAIKGVVAWQTPVGTFHIWSRVPNETMSSAGLGIPPDAPDGYLVRDVLFTQYFTRGGAALHYNYWSSNFGYAGSHGCLGLNYADSEWFWNWAEIGTPVVVHH